MRELEKEKREREERRREKREERERGRERDTHVLLAKQTPASAKHNEDKRTKGSGIEESRDPKLSRIGHLSP